MNQIVLINCPDEKGLIHRITSIILKYNLNIIEMNEFVDIQNKHFFARFVISGTQLEENVFENELKTVLPPQSSIQMMLGNPKKIVILVTKEHHCLCDLLTRNHFKELNCTIEAVIGNYETLAEITNKYDIPFYTVSTEGKSKDEYEAELINLISRVDIDYLILAKFMRILSPKFVESFEHKIINIHHSFLPAFIGANPYRQAFERGVKLIGATAHFVTNDLDEGPIIAQQIVPVDHRHSVKDMVMAGHEVERNVLAHALNLLLEDRVLITGNKTILFD